MGFWNAWAAAAIAAAALLNSGASAQQAAPHSPPAMKAVTLGALAEQGFEVKAVGKGEGLILQKGKDVYLCTLRLSTGSPLSYLSECYSVR
jgi:hypothetical protein